LIREQGVDPGRILYFAFDDPELFAAAQLQRVIFDQLVEHFERQDSLAYFFLDEIQRLPQWELHLKKAYDLKRRIRFVVSGSGLVPDFPKQPGNALGSCEGSASPALWIPRILPVPTSPEAGVFADPRSHRVLRAALLAGDGQGAAECVNRLHEALQPFHAEVSQAMAEYCMEGGFPEVWALADPVRKIEYLMEQQVRKVLYEDLMTLTQYRKPENVLRFFVYLLAHPGHEINTAKVSQAIGIERRVVDENLPRLELTDLLIRIQRFSHQPLRVRKGNIKCYPVDLALRNAVLKTWDMPDAAMMGFTPRISLFGN